MAKTKKQETKEATDSEVREDAINSAHISLKKAKTADDVRKVWKDHYLVIGHRVLGRLLLGQDVASATRTRRKEN